MGQFEALLEIREGSQGRTILMVHYDTDVLLLRVEDLWPLLWSGRSRTDANLTNMLFEGLELKDKLKAKYSAGRLSIIDGDGQLQEETSDKKELKGDIIHAWTFRRFLKSPQDFIAAAKAA